VGGYLRKRGDDAVFFPDLLSSFSVPEADCARKVSEWNRGFGRESRQVFPSLGGLQGHIAEVDSAPYRGPFFFPLLLSPTSPLFREKQG